MFSAVCGVVMLWIWDRYSYEIETTEQTPAAKGPKGQRNALWSPLMIGIMAAIILQGMLRDGVTTWMPSYLSETYRLSNRISILTGVVLPLFSIVYFQIAIRLHMKKLTNPLTCAGVFFAAGACSALVLWLLAGQSAVFSVLLSATLTGCMHGVNLMLICMIPPYFKTYGTVSTVSGVINSCTYIGSALSTYGIAVLSKEIGWHYTVLVWFLVALAGTVLCVSCAKPWKHKFPARQSDPI